MGNPEQNLQVVIGDIARAFVELCYAEEKPYFANVWTSFQELLSLRPGEMPETRALRDWASGVPAGVGLDTEAQLDLVTPIVLATLTVTLRQAREETLTRVDLGSLTAKVARGFGARGELLARLTRHLPALCSAVVTARLDVAEAYVSMARRPQYEIWSQGKHGFVRSIEEYQNRKEQCLIWIDLSERKHRSHRWPNQTLQEKPIKFLICLAGQLGNEVLLVEILRSVWNDKLVDVNSLNTAHRNKTDQQIVKLNQFTNGEFRKYLFRGKFGEGLGLKRSFASQYFIFNPPQ